MKNREEPSAPIRVIIADASQLTCELMAKALGESRQRVNAVGLATDSSGVLKVLAATPASLAVISANLADGCNAGFQVAREVRAAHPRIRIILMVDSNDRSAVVEAFRARADGVFTRDGSFELLCKCIQAVHEGQIWANSSQLRFLIEVLGERGFEQIKSATGGNLLTKREDELAHWVAEGLTNADISRQLNLTEHTVRNYLFRVFNKLGVSNRLELALYVLKQREGGRGHVWPSSTVGKFTEDGATTDGFAVASSGIDDGESDAQLKPRNVVTEPPTTPGTRSER